MALFITSLNSGSNGNCYYVGNEDEAVLIDAGISCREIEKRMKRSGLEISKVKAIFVSHEHCDHIKGLTTLTKKYLIPVFITSATLFHSGCIIDKQQVKSFTENEPVKVGRLSIVAFSKMHDATDPFSFTVSYKANTVGIFTDIGVACKNVVQHFKKCHAAFLEANYDEEMLTKGNYPYHLKKRITGGNGHLSNSQALTLFKKHRPHFMTHLVLSHLSKNNNCPILTKNLFDEHANGVNIIVASRYEETEVICIGAAIRSTVKPATKQLTLVFD
jgi:phosphoribosyl 1,2-cyclic phosphodiesterase